MRLFIDQSYPILSIEYTFRHNCQYEHYQYVNVIMNMNFEQYEHMNILKLFKDVS